MDAHGAPPSRSPPGAPLAGGLDPLSSVLCLCGSAAMVALALTGSAAGTEPERELFGFKLLRFGPRAWLPALYLIIALALALAAAQSLWQHYTARPAESAAEKVRATLAAARQQAAKGGGSPRKEPEPAGPRKRRNTTKAGQRAAVAKAAATRRRRPAVESVAVADAWDGGGGTIADGCDDSPDTPWCAPSNGPQPLS